MKPYWQILRASALLLGLGSAPELNAATTWHYQATNAFPGLFFSNPVCLASPPGETNRLFVVEKHGRIVVITNLANPTRTIFMDISRRVTVGNVNEASDVFGEEGLLGLAFHPGFATNGYFYVFYTGQATNGASGLHDILSRFQVSASNPNAGDPNSEVQFIAQYDQADNHNAGDLHFGPDGYLYVSLGDEGGGGDTCQNSQRIDKDFFSAIMRIDVDKRPGNLPPNPHVSLNSLTNYAVPADNPWVGATDFNGQPVNPNQVRTEFWAVGMRNPWRFSYDPPTGEWYLGHVGQNAIEWVDLVTKGANCGWNYYEGDQPYAGTPPPGFTYTHPLIEYAHANGRNCVIGGIVYRGSRLPALNGAYLYADLSSGEVWALRHSGTNVTQTTIIPADAGEHISCFGVDPSNGEALYAALRSGNNSIIQRIVSTNTVPVINAVTLSGANLVVSGTNGAENGNYYVLASTNLAAAPAVWSPVATNPFDAAGNFTFTNPIDPHTPKVFYRVQLQ